MIKKNLICFHHSILRSKSIIFNAHTTQPLPELRLEHIYLRFPNEKECGHKKRIVIIWRARLHNRPPVVKYSRLWFYDQYRKCRKKMSFLFSGPRRKSHARFSANEAFALDRYKMLARFAVRFPGRFPPEVFVFFILLNDHLSLSFINFIYISISKYYI